MKYQDIWGSDNLNILWTNILNFDTVYLKAELGKLTRKILLHLFLFKFH